jgi:hypothetical protein
VAIKITIPTTIPIVAPVCKPLLGEGVNTKGGVLAWYEVLVIKGTDVIVVTGIIVVRAEEFVIAITSKIV